jgi:ABC-type Mn2+/Zn2+ transport system permease subunit
MTESGTVYSIILAFLFAVAAGLVGSFALMKRMILAADVISHVALPGLGLAFLVALQSPTRRRGHTLHWHAADLGIAKE